MAQFSNVALAPDSSVVDTSLDSLGAGVRLMFKPTMGTWWLADRPEIQVPGYLQVDESHLWIATHDRHEALARGVAHPLTDEPSEAPTSVKSRLSMSSRLGDPPTSAHAETRQLHTNCAHTRPEVVPSSVELRWRPDDHQAAFTFSS